MYTCQITSKGQTTIPKEIRRHLKLKQGDKVRFVINDRGEVCLIPLTATTQDLAGVLPKPKKPVTTEAMDRAIRERMHEAHRD